MSSISLTLGLRGRLLSGTQTTLQGTLFGNNEPGFTFEPWDITTLYQDRAGTTPVTAAGQSVGLRLSKDQGLRIGPELVTNGTFDGNLTGWSVTNVVWSSGAASFTGVPSLSQNMTLVSGVTYRVSVTVSGLTGGSLWLRFIGGTAANSSSFGNGTTTFLLRSNGNTALLIEQVSGTITAGTIDNISVRELAGNHEVAVSDAKRGVYGWMPETGRRNQLTYTEQFDNAVWTKNNATVTANATIAPNGTLTANRITPDAVSTQHVVEQQPSPQPASGTVSLSAYFKAGELTKAVIRTYDDVTVRQALFNLSTGLVETGSGTVSAGLATIESVGNGWYKCSLLAGTTKGSALKCSLRLCPSTVTATDPGASWAGNNTDGGYIWGAQLEVGSIATAYQRVASQYDITEAGVPTCYYVQADGVDDAYVTPTITPNTDKVQVFAGVRKLSDATGIIIEPSTLSGSFYLVSGSDTGVIGLANGYTSNAHGSAAASAQQNSQIVVNGPDSAVITATHDIAGDLSTIRRNGIAGASGTGDKGTGNFLAYPAYIYGRAGTSLPFNGLDFGHAVRFGPNLDAATIARVESLIARNTPEVTL